MKLSVSLRGPEFESLWCRFAGPTCAHVLSRYTLAMMRDRLHTAKLLAIF